MSGKLKILVVILIVASLLAGLIFLSRDKILAKIYPPLVPLTLYGNVDDRQVNVSFMIQERVKLICVEEGDFVHAGDLLGELETVRIQNRIAEAVATVEIAQAKYDKAVNGYRKEEVAMAEAGVDIVKAQINAAQRLYERNKGLAKTNAVSQQDADDAEANYNKLQAELELAQNNFNRIFSGTRSEDIAAAKATLDQAKAALAIQQQNMTDTKLLSPCDGIVRSRILEPGEMAAPQTTALILAIVSPKWVRVYLSEPLLPKIKSGDKADIVLDGLSDKKLEGWVGYISPNAEFTPKNVETTELRTSLVYEVRVHVKDPDNILKLGQPATVMFPEVMVEP